MAFSSYMYKQGILRNGLLATAMRLVNNAKKPEIIHRMKYIVYIYVLSTDM
jgi:hypothetical protein